MVDDTRDLLRAQVASEFALPSTWSDRLTGDTVAALRAAARLAKVLGIAQPEQVRERDEAGRFVGSMNERIRRALYGGNVVALYAPPRAPNHDVASIGTSPGRSRSCRSAHGAAAQRNIVWMQPGRGECRGPRSLRVMAERLDYALVSTSHGVVVLPWDSRRELVDQLRKYGETAISVIKAFDAVGATRPVRLTSPEKGVILGAVFEWSRTVPYDELPEAVWELRDALIVDLDVAT